MNRKLYNFAYLIFSIGLIGTFHIMIFGYYYYQIQIETSSLWFMIFPTLMLIGIIFLEYYKKRSEK